jgi:non-specific serine/threonine protein kinase
MRQIQLLREVGDFYMLGVSLSLNSFAAMTIGKYEEAHAMLDEALPLLREAGDPYRIAMALNYMGDLARCEQNYQQAQTAYEESVSLLRKIDAVRDLASALHNLGHTCLHLGDIERAKALFGESMTSHQEQGNRPGMVECLLGYAALAITADLPAAGARLLAAAAEIGGRHITFEWAATRMEYEHYQGRARAGLAEPAFQSEQAAGQRLSLEQALVYAQDVAKKVAAAQQTRQQLDQLSPREREVAVLIAQAKSNDEIAAALVVSKRTVESHIANIRSKLGFTERAQIVRWAFESGLVKASE